MLNGRNQWKTTKDEYKKKYFYTNYTMFKLYNVDSPRLKTPEPIFIQDEINNLEKYMKYMQASIKMIPFYPPSQYKFLWPQGEQDKQYWNKIVVEFLKKKHNMDTMREEFLIEMYTGDLSHEPYFIILAL